MHRWHLSDTIPLNCWLCAANTNAHLLVIVFGVWQFAIRLQVTEHFFVFLRENLGEKERDLICVINLPS